MRIIIIVVVVAFAALSLGATDASAKVLTTPPFPAQLVSSGQAGCQATNLGKKNGELAIELIDNIGMVVGSLPPTIVPPGVTPLDVLVTITPPTYPTFCRFTFNGKFSGVYFYRNGDAVEVVPTAK